jgi:hypothetical protein
MPAYLDGYPRLLLRTETQAIAFQPIQTVVRNPVDDKAVWGKQTQFIRRFNRLQGPDPGIEILFRQIAFQCPKALFPKGRVCRRVLCHGVLIADD